MNSTDGSPPEVDWTTIYTSAFWLNGISIFFSLVGLVLYTIRRVRFPFAKPSLQIKLGVALLVVDVFYSAFQILSDSPIEGFLCGFSVWGWALGTQLSCAYTIVILHNVIRGVDSKSKPDSYWEAKYLYAPVPLGLIVTMIPAFDSAYGFNDDLQSCWFVGDRSIIWGWFTMYIWVVLSTVFSVFTAVYVNRKLQANMISPTANAARNDIRNAPRINPSVKGVQSVTDLRTIEAFKRSQSYSKKLIFLLFPYAVIILFTQIFELLQDSLKSDTLNNNFGFDFLASNMTAFQGLLHFILILRNPNLLTTQSNDLHILKLVFEIEACREAFLDFLRNIFCEENLELYLLIKEFQGTFEYNETTKTYSKTEDTIRKFKAIMKGSERLNVPDALMSEMKQFNETKISYELFDPVVTQLQQMMLTDSIPKFLKSKEYKGIEEIVKVERLKSNLIDNKPLP